MPLVLGIARRTSLLPSDITLSTALRQSWTGMLTGWVFWLWLPLVGFRPLMVLTMQAISLLYQVLDPYRTCAFARSAGK